MTLGSVEIEHGAQRLTASSGGKLAWLLKTENLKNSWVSSQPHLIKFPVIKWQSICSYYSCFWPLLEIILACKEQNEFVFFFLRKPFLRGKFTHK